MAPGDAAAEIVRYVEDRGVHRCHPAIESQQVGIYPAGFGRRLAQGRTLTAEGCAV